MDLSGASESVFLYDAERGPRGTIFISQAYRQQSDHVIQPPNGLSC